MYITSTIPLQGGGSSSGIDEFPRKGSLLAFVPTAQVQSDVRASVSAI